MEHTRRPGPTLPFSDFVKKFPESASHAKGGAALRVETLLGGCYGPEFVISTNMGAADANVSYSLLVCVSDFLLAWFPKACCKDLMSIFKVHPVEVPDNAFYPKFCVSDSVAGNLYKLPTFQSS